MLHLCVMSAKRPNERVGIRELRQNLSVYVKRVREEGRAYEVTERGEPVARLTPLEGRPMSRIERMIADGRITPASRTWTSCRRRFSCPPGARCPRSCARCATRTTGELVLPGRLRDREAGDG